MVADALGTMTDFGSSRPVSAPAGQRNEAKPQAVGGAVYVSIACKRF
jgi:hypothetical protein